MFFAPESLTVSLWSQMLRNVCKMNVSVGIRIFSKWNQAGCSVLHKNACQFGFLSSRLTLCHNLQQNTTRVLLLALDITTCVVKCFFPLGAENHNGVWLVSILVEKQQCTYSRRKSKPCARAGSGISGSDVLHVACCCPCFTNFLWSSEQVHKKVYVFLLSAKMRNFGGFSWPMEGKVPDIADGWVCAVTSCFYFYTFVRWNPGCSEKKWYGSRCSVRIHQFLIPCSCWFLPASQALWNVHVVNFDVVRIVKFKTAGCGCFFDNLNRDPSVTKTSITKGQHLRRGFVSFVRQVRFVQGKTTMQSHQNGRNMKSCSKHTVVFGVQNTPKTERALSQLQNLFNSAGYLSHWWNSARTNFLFKEPVL